MVSMGNLHWFRWDTNEVYRMNVLAKTWVPRVDIKITQKFLFFSSIVHLPSD
jgi:hypothetical protein